MTDRPFCLHCGYNLTADEPIEYGDWRLAPEQTTYRGDVLRITPAGSAFLHTLAKAKGRPVRTAVIANRISSASEEPESVIYVLVNKLRQHLPVVPFVTVHHRGYRWAA